MEKAKIVETNLRFANELSERDTTDMIVIHHTGGSDIDASAKEIHGWHLNNGWAGIGYHFVIRKDGTIERGRPAWAVGAHAYEENSHTIGIHLSGDFDSAYPTTAQVEKASLLIANLCDEYDIPIDREHIVGHGELMATSCPGSHLQALLDDGTITGKANFYRFGPPEDESTNENEDQNGSQEGETIMRYNKIVEMPQWARPTIKKMIDKGLLIGGGTKDENGLPADMDLSLDMIRIFVMNDRAGIYDK